MFSDAGTYCSKRRHCNILQFVTNCSETHIKRPKESIVIESSTCISKDIVHGIICKQCHIVYIVETGRRLADKITEHIRSTPPHHPMAQRFNPPSCWSLNDFAATGIIHCNSSNENQLNIDNHIIYKLGNLSRLGHNNKFHCFHLKKGHCPKRFELNQF